MSHNDQANRFSNEDEQRGARDVIGYPNSGDQRLDPAIIAEGRAIQSHFELRVYEKAVALRQEVFRLTKPFPKEELFALTAQIRNSSRSVAAAIAEAWRRRRYPAAFVSKLNEAEGEAAETQTWLECAFECNYISDSDRNRLHLDYEGLLRMLVGMQIHSEAWTRSPKKPAAP